jgi:hypothetical protein
VAGAANFEDSMFAAAMPQDLNRINQLILILR